MTENATNSGHINYESIFAVAVSSALWRLGYEATRYVLPKKNPEYSCRIISFVHGLVMAFIGINQCFMIDSPFDHPEWKTTYMQSFLMVTSLGYFVHDLAWCLQHQTEDRLMIAHHVYSVCALFRMLFKGYSGAQATCALGSMELTNPFLQARWFIRSEGMYPSVLFTSVETTFMIVFIAIRIVLGTYFILSYFNHDLAWCLQHQIEDRLMIAHHVYSVCALFRMLFKVYSGAQATCALGSMELTNPFLQARWFIRSEGMYLSVLFTSVETTFMIVFIAIRIVLGTYFILGYFVHDLAWCLQHQTEDRLMIAHHVYSVCALFRMLFKGYSGAQATCALGSMELTNPFLQARWFIRSEGMYPSVLFTSVETTFMIVFIAIRIVLGTYFIMIRFIRTNHCFMIDSSFDQPEWKTTYMQSFLMVTSLGYLVHDLAWCLQYQTEDRLMIAHHVHSVCALFRKLLNGYSGAQATLCFGGHGTHKPLSSS
ncbi:unnamed protein product [Phaedon cochleariae]|uniref:TLC domain-containing protein n=1 Tax=Phaedon cochleariae TaxID=80249 RepID=A0A9N9SHM1_PHACE|nr:unnamed protein product [Phaedon cochleariae]